MYQICSKYENEELDVLESADKQWIPQSFESLNDDMIVCYNIYTLIYACYVHCNWYQKIIYMFNNNNSTVIT